MTIGETAAMATYSTAGEIRYLESLELYKTEKPYEVTFLPVNVEKPGARRSNISLESWPVQLRDFSGSRQAFSTDVQGFELDMFPTSLSPSELKDLRIVQSRYYHEATAYLTRKYGAKRVFIFDTTIREAKKPKHDSSALLRNHQLLGPSTDCHVDQSPGSVRRRVRHSFPDEADHLLRQRVRVINIWRPLVWPAHTNPLAMCDWRSTVYGDYTLSDHKTPVWEGESLQVHHNPSHQWWFAKKMVEDDVLLIKMYDSDAIQPGSEVAMCKFSSVVQLIIPPVPPQRPPVFLGSRSVGVGTPHCSFEWKDAPEETQLRQSMEIRAIVFS
ncbi:hypothetical protein MKZ38_001006 [Zalerion maritima]|uniref:Uncharacterized protein n=1 Tax=Zalerion maritima TaxID=339359 RepID=A0AAD5WTD2_9PEZI|nr:hypothetical protein MKZ38_001006 [Zalerion maritima]